MMLRHGRIFGEGKVLWTKKHMAWFERQEFEFDASNEAMRSSIREVRRYEKSIEDLDRRIESISATLERVNLVHALRAFKGIKTLTAATLVAEIGDLKRFPSAGKFSSFLDLPPSEQSSGESRNRGRITQAGNRRVRPMLVEAAWAYRRSPHVSRELLARSHGVSDSVRDIT